MAFIAIDAKADIEGSKKGKLTPAQHAQLNAWCLFEKTGIFDALERCESKQPSWAVDNGSATVVLNEGYVVICGRLVHCEQDTTVVVPAPVSGTQEGRIVLRYSLGSTKEAEFKAYTITGYPAIQDLNNNPMTGVYEFEIYRYTATPQSVTLERNETATPIIPNIKNGVKAEIQKALENTPLWEVKGDGTSFINIDTGTPNGSNNKSYFFSSSTNNFSNTPLRNYTGKFEGYRIVRSYKKEDALTTHTIVELHETYPQAGRVWIRIYDNGWDEGWKTLGFKSGVGTFCGVSFGDTANTDTSQNGIYKLGKFVIVRASLSVSLTTEFLQTHLSNGTTALSIPDDIPAPKYDLRILITTKVNGFNAGRTILCKLSKDSRKVIVESSTYLMGNSDIGYDGKIDVQFGYEIA